MATARYHEQVQPVANITSCCRVADLLQVFDGPRRGIERVCPSLIDEQFSAVVLERAEVGVDGVDESSDAGVEVCNVGGPVETRGVVGKAVVNGVLQNRCAEGLREITLLQCPFDLGARGEAWVELCVGLGVYWAGVDGFGCGELGVGEAG